MSCMWYGVITQHALQILLEAGLALKGRIAVTQPRRVVRLLLLTMA